jgi:hypothetical protein
MRMTLAGAAALTLAGCSGSSNFFDNKNEGGWFTKPVDIFNKQDWTASKLQVAELGPSGPVGPEDLVNADGSCAPSAEVVQPAAAPQAAGAAAPLPDRLEPEGAAPAGGPTVYGGIALGMTECQAVRRGGSPSNVAISAGEKGERRVVLTYVSGVWPGIYTFDSGRLKTIDMLPDAQKPKAPARKPARRAKQAAHEVERVYVR